jgi:hypothetical protein
MNKIQAIRKKLWVPPRDPDDVPPLGSRQLLVHWVREEEPAVAPMIDLVQYGKLLSVLPDKIVNNLERARLERAGRGPLLKAGLGYEELLASVIVDGTAIASSSTENFLFPALAFPRNYMQPGGIPGRTLHWKARGRVTTLTTAATLTFKFGAALTNVIPTTTWAVSGAITMDATAQTNSQWFTEGAVVARSVGSAGTVFAQGDCMVAAQALTIANQHADFMGSAGQDTPAAVTMDMTVDQYLSLTGKWSLATAYSITGHIFMLESLN